MRVLGNDVVDLADAETRIDGLHPRFAERVFTSGERAELAASPSPHVLHWALWAGKESAYKALKRLEPELVFAPRDFEVQLVRPAVEAGGRTSGQVTHHGRTLVLDVHVDDGSVHAIARDRDTPAGDVLAGVAPAGADASATVRLVAIENLAATLGIEPEALRICDRPPVVWQRDPPHVAAHDDRPSVAGRRDQPLDLVLSLSHHGRFVAFAAAPLAPLSSARTGGRNPATFTRPGSSL